MAWCPRGLRGKGRDSEPAPHNVCSGISRRDALSEKGPVTAGSGSAVAALAILDTSGYTES